MTLYKMGKGKEFYDSARQTIGKSTAKVKGYFAKSHESKENREELFNTPEMRERLGEYAEFADHLGHKYKAAFKSDDKRRRRNVAGTIGAAGGALAYKETFHETVKGWANTFYNDAMALKDLVKTAENLVPGGEQKQIRDYLNAHQGLADSLGQTARQYQTNISSMKTTLRDLKIAADDLGRIAQNAPGYDSNVVKKLTKLRNKILSEMSEKVTGKDQSDRLSQEYEMHYNALNGLLNDAVNKKGKANENIADIVNHAELLESSGQQLLQREQKEMEKFMSKYNAYTKLIEDFGKLDTGEIRTKGPKYQELIKTAEANDLTLPHYQDVGTMISIGTGLLAAYVTGKTSARWLNWMVPSRKFNGEKEAYKYLENRFAQEEPKSRKKSDLESKAESSPWSGPEIVILAISLMIIIAGESANMTGLAVSGNSEIVTNLSLLVASFSLLFLSITKIYKIAKVK